MRRGLQLEQRVYYHLVRDILSTVTPILTNETYSNLDQSYPKYPIGVRIQQTTNANAAIGVTPIYLAIQTMPYTRFAMR
jgi:hypothetical protein